MNLLLSKMSIDAISAVSDDPVAQEDVDAAFRSVNIEPVHDTGTFDSGPGFVRVAPPSTRAGVRLTLEAVDLSDPDIVTRVLRYAARVAELYSAGRDSKPDRLVRLRNSLHDDGFALDAPGDAVGAITDLAAHANSALPDAAAIRLELTRMERALPSDTGALIGRAKNLIEATSKAVLLLRGEPVNDTDKVTQLVSKATKALEVHAAQASGPQVEQVRKMLGRLHGLTHDIAELRNSVGDGHGLSGIPAIDAAAGRLAARAAIAWCAFMLEVAQIAGPAPSLMP